MPREGEEYTPQEFVDMFMSATPEKRLEVAGIILEGHRKGTRCWLEDHQAQLAETHRMIETSYRQGWTDFGNTIKKGLENGNV